MACDQCCRIISSWSNIVILFCMCWFLLVQCRVNILFKILLIKMRYCKSKNIGSCVINFKWNFGLIITIILDNSIFDSFFIMSDNHSQCICWKTKILPYIAFSTRIFVQHILIPVFVQHYRNFTFKSEKCKCVVVYGILGPWLWCLACFIFLVCENRSSS